MAERREVDERDELIRGLLVTPPAEFVAERNRIVKELRSGGDRDTAAAVAALRRPTVADWAFNVVAVEHPDEVNAFVDAAEAAEAAQTAAIEGSGRSDVRQVLAELRTQTTKVVELARAGAARGERTAAGSSVGVLTARLAGIASNEASREQLRSGMLGVDDSGSVDLLGRLAASTARTPPRRRRARGEGPQSRRTSERAAPRDDEAVAEERRARVRALADAERAQTVAAKRLAEADSRIGRLEAAVERADQQVHEAERRLDEARARQRSAGDDLRRGEERRTVAADELQRAEAAVADARRDVDADADM